jgi:(2Fe-2S) ferredoxin
VVLAASGTSPEAQIGEVYHCFFEEKSSPMSDNPYYEHHVFFCLNQREEGRPCCFDKGAQAAQEHAKSRIKQLGLNGQGKVRINKAGCLDRCEEGPVLVVYPEGTWYTYVDKDDIDEIIDQHLVGGKVVERLKI